MTVTSKWVALHEVSDYLKKGWREVKLEGGFKHVALMVSPEEPASEMAAHVVEYPVCPNCWKMDTGHSWRVNGLLRYTCQPASEPAKVETLCPNCGEREVGQHQARDGGETFYTCKPAQPEPVANIVLDGATEHRRRADLQRDLDRLPEPVAGTLTFDLGAETVTFTPEPVADVKGVRFEDWPAAQERAIAEIEARPQVDGGQRIGGDEPEPVAEEMPEAVREPAPPNSLPNYGECALRVANSNFLAKRKAEGGYGPEHSDTPQASALHRFIYEYDDADPYRSAWFLHRLELVVNAVRSQPAKVRMTPELETILAQTLATANHFLTMPGTVADVGRDLLRDIAAVRTQAAEAADASAVYDKGFADGIALQKKCGAEAGKVRMPKVRDMLNSALAQTTLQVRQDEFLAALAELDAAEGRK